MIKLFFKGFKEGFKEFGHRISSVVNFIMLFVVYFSALALTSICAKLFKKHFLNLKNNKKVTYWVTREPIENKLENFYKQF